LLSTSILNFYFLFASLRMRLTPLCAAILVLVAAPMARAQMTAAGDSDVSTIRDRENVWAIAIAERDSSALVPILAPEYKVLANAGAPAESRAQAIHETALPPDSAHHINRVTFDTLDIRMTARDRAVAKGVVREVGTNAKGPITERIRFVDVWVRRQHRWLCISSLFTPVKG
jgi:ketosteroid isomerase-like protein